MTGYGVMVALGIFLWVAAVTAWVCGGSYLISHDGQTNHIVGAAMIVAVFVGIFVAIAWAASQ